VKNYFEKLRAHIAENPPNFGDSDSVLTLLYEANSESNRMDDVSLRMTSTSCTETNICIG